MSTTLQRLLPATLLASVLLAGCLPPDVVDEQKKVGSFKDYITIGDKVFTEAPAATGWTPFQAIGGPYFDPYVAGWIGLTSFPEIAIAAAARGGSPGGTDQTEFAAIGIANFPSLLGAAPADYSVAFPPQDGKAFVEYINFDETNFIVCLSNAGTVHVENFEPVGGTIYGTFDITDMGDPEGGPCAIPSPVSGAFRVTRIGDDRTGNDGTGTDNVSVTHFDTGSVVIFSSTYQEAASPLNNPLLQAYFEEVWDGYFEQVFQRLALDLSMDGDRTIAAYQRQYKASYFDVTGPGVYPKVGNDGLDLRTKSASTSSSCSGTDGPLTIAALGPVGGLVTGSFLSDSLGAPAPGCPDVFTGNFVVTREADRKQNVPELTGDTLTIGSTIIRGRKNNIPSLSASVSLTTPLEELFLNAFRFSSKTGAQESVTIEAFNPAATVQGATSYSLTNANTPLDGQASVRHSGFASGSGSDCVATAGTLTISSYGGLNGYVQGDFNVTADDDSLNPGFPCPTPLGAGVFNIKVVQIDTFGNDGSGKDSFSLNIGGPPVVTFTESATPYNETVAYALGDPPGNQTTISLQSGVNRATAKYTYDLRFTIPVGPDAGLVGTFTQGTNLNALLGGVWGGLCSPLTGTSTVHIAAAGAIGQQITGDYSITNDDTAAPSCPFAGTSIFGNFAVTRESDIF